MSINETVGELALDLERSYTTILMSTENLKVDFNDLSAGMQQIVAMAVFSATYSDKTLHNLGYCEVVHAIDYANNGEVSRFCEDFIKRTLVKIDKDPNAKRLNKERGMKYGKHDAPEDSCSVC